MCRLLPASPSSSPPSLWSPQTIELLRSPPSSAVTMAYSDGVYAPRGVSTPSTADVRAAKADIEFTPLSAADGATWRVALEWLGVPCASPPPTIGLSPSASSAGLAAAPLALPPPADEAMAVFVQWLGDGAGAALPFASSVPVTPPPPGLSPLPTRWLSDMLTVPAHLPAAEFGMRYSPVRVHLPFGSGVVLFHLPLPLQVR